MTSRNSKLLIVLMIFTVAFLATGFFLFGSKITHLLDTFPDYPGAKTFFSNSDLPLSLKYANCGESFVAVDSKLLTAKDEIDSILNYYANIAQERNLFITEGYSSVDLVQPTKVICYLARDATGRKRAANVIIVLELNEKNLSLFTPEVSPYLQKNNKAILLLRSAIYYL